MQTSRWAVFSNHYG